MGTPYMGEESPYGTPTQSGDQSSQRRSFRRSEVRHRHTRTATEEDNGIVGGASPGSTSLGRYSPGYPRGLYSVTQ